MYKIECVFCTNEFSCIRKKQKYCSRKCFLKFKQSRNNIVVCNYCKLSFSIKKSALKNTNYCSKKCSIMYRNSPNKKHIRRGKYTLNDKYFEIIDTQDKAYWIGFLAGDGNINKTKLRLDLDIKDKNHLQKFLDCIESNAPIKKRAHNNVHYICISGSNLIRDLKKYNIVPNKTHTYIPFNIPYEFISHFIRGYVDSDGSFFKCNYKRQPNFSFNIRFSIVCNLQTANYIQKILVNECGLNYTKIEMFKHSPTTANLKYSGNKQILKIAKWLYNDANIYLKRKYDIAFSAE